MEREWSLRGENGMGDYESGGRGQNFGNGRGSMEVVGSSKFRKGGGRVSPIRLSGQFCPDILLTG